MLVHFREQYIFLNTPAVLHSLEISQLFPYTVQNFYLLFSCAQPACCETLAGSSLPPQRVAVPWPGKAFGDYWDAKELFAGTVTGSSPRSAPCRAPACASPHPSAPKCPASMSWLLDPATNIPTSNLSAMAKVHVVILQAVNSPV